LGDAAKTERVAAIVARQYRDLRAIHDAREPDASARLEKLHGEFLARLAAELTPAQVDAVKDGLTYGVAPLTFRVYTEMLPNLTAEQKERIHAWLLEARELAMDRGSSEEKHTVFGKYKGKINNFLAAAGIDMKQAEKDLAARRKAASTGATK
jgi:hypothetical protein